MEGACQRSTMLTVTRCMVCVSSGSSAPFPALPSHLQVQEVRVVEALAEVVQAAEHVLKVFCQQQRAGSTAGARWVLLLILRAAALLLRFGLQKGAVRQ